MPKKNNSRISASLLTAAVMISSPLKAEFETKDVAFVLAPLLIKINDYIYLEDSLSKDHKNDLTACLGWDWFRAEIEPEIVFPGRLDSMMQSVTSRDFQAPSGAGRTDWQNQMTQSTIQQLNESQEPTDINRYRNIHWITEQTARYTRDRSRDAADLKGSMPEEVLKALDDFIGLLRKEKVEDKKIKQWWRFLIATDTVYAIKIAYQIEEGKNNKKTGRWNYFSSWLTKGDNNNEALTLIQMFIQRTYNNMSGVRQFVNTLATIEMPADLFVSLITDYIIQDISGDGCALGPGDEGQSAGASASAESVQPSSSFLDFTRVYVLFLLTFHQPTLNHLIANFNFPFTRNLSGDQRDDRRRRYPQIHHHLDQLLGQILPEGERRQALASSFSEVLIQVILRESALMDRLDNSFLNPPSVTDENSRRVLDEVEGWASQSEGVNTAYIVFLLITEPRLIRMISDLDDQSARSFLAWLSINYSSLTQSFESGEYPLLHAVAQSFSRQGSLSANDELVSRVEHWIQERDFSGIEARNVAQTLVELYPDLRNEVFGADTSIKRVLHGKYQTSSGNR